MQKLAEVNRSAQIIRCSFSDIDELAVTINASRNIQLTQLDTQKFQADLLLARFDEAEFFFAEASCPVYTLGAKRPDYLDFSCALQVTDASIISHHYRLSPNTLFGFDSNRETRIVVPANLKLSTIQIRQDLFEDCLQVMERSDIDSQFLSTNYLSAPITLPAVRAYLLDLMRLIQQQPNFLKLTQLKKLILDDFIPLLIQAIPLRNETSTHRSTRLNRTKLVKQAEDYMLAHLDQPLTLKDLCKALNSNSRSMFYGFQEMFGLSPMAYLKIQRLHGVRRLLKAADPTNSSIMAIANQFGFWSSGHFARDYKKMFGELPSQTIKR